MSCNNMLKAVGIVFLGLVSLQVGYAQQPNLKYTKIVDQNGAPDANYTKIQDAIDLGVPTDPDKRWTILIYAGTYDTQAITLGDTKENVDLVGVDRDAVIIKAPADTDAITISGSGVRNNTIRNLTIITDDDTADEGRGIVIEKSGVGADPSAIKIIGVTIKCQGNASNGIDVEDSGTDLEIRNVGISTADGHGIKIVKGDGSAVPKEILIENVTIEVAGSAKDGIYASETQDLRVANCKITTGNGHGIEFVKPGGGSDPNDIVIEGVTIEATGSNKLGISGSVGENVSVLNCTVTSDAAHGIAVGGENWTIKGSRAQGKIYGLNIVPGADGVEIDSSVFRGGIGVSIGPGTGGKNILIRDSHLRGDHTLNDTGANTGLYADGSANENIVVKGCLIEAISDGKVARAVWHDIRDLRLESCRIVARNLKKDADPGEGDAIGVSAGSTETTIVGGSIETSSLSERETELWDVIRTAAYPVRISGTRLSKWKGPIASAERPRSVVQRTIDVDLADDDWILVDTDLPTSGADDFQAVDPSNQPDVYRTLVVRGVEVGGAFSITGNVFVVGTDWGDNRIAGSFDISTGNHQDIGDKPFKTVTKIYLPIDASNVGKVKVGTTSKLGLYFPISAASDVLQLGKKASAATSYTIQPSVGTVDATYATVQPLVAIAGGDSFEWVVLASQ